MECGFEWFDPGHLFFMVGQSVFFKRAIFELGIPEEINLKLKSSKCTNTWCPSKKPKSFQA